MKSSRQKKKQTRGEATRSPQIGAPAPRPVSSFPKCRACGSTDYTKIGATRYSHAQDHQILVSCSSCGTVRVLG